MTAYLVGLISELLPIAAFFMIVGVFFVFDIKRATDKSHFLKRDLYL